MSSFKIRLHWRAALDLDLCKVKIMNKKQLGTL